MQKQIRSYELFIFTLVIGFVAAILSLGLLLFFYTFHFIPFHPFQLETTVIMKDHWFMKGLYYIVLFILLVVISITFSLIYFLLFKKYKQWQVGALYGIVLWAICYIGLPYILFDKWLVISGAIKSTVTMFCFFLLYGVFVGYSISYQDKSIAITSSS